MSRYAKLKFDEYTTEDGNNFVIHKNGSTYTITVLEPGYRVRKERGWRRVPITGELVNHIIENSKPDKNGLEQLKEAKRWFEMMESW